MAHVIPKEALVPGFESRPVTDEKGHHLQNFTLEDVLFSLRLLAYNNSNANGTAAQLENDYNLKVHPITLRKWMRESFPQRYVQIQHQLANEINEKLAATTIDLAAKAGAAQELALDRTIDEIDNIDPKYLGGTVRNLAQAGSANIEKARLLREQPTEIVRNQTPDDAIKLLRELGLLKDSETVESSAREIEE